MDFFSYVTGLIGQSGRRGATMLSIDCTHPDLEEFINLKSDLNLCTKANISVRVSDDFMNAVINDKDWTLFFDTEHEHIEKIVKAKDIFMLLAKRNWEMAEPGILYWDNIKYYNMLNTNKEFKYAGVNPCAEEPLPAGSSCLLGSLNLSEFVNYPFTKSACVDYNSLTQAVHIAIEGLNDVLIEGMNLHPLEIQKQSVYNWRAIGLGTFGLGDMLIKLGIQYGSLKSIKIINQVFKTIAVESVLKSLELAKIHDCYPKCNKEALISSSFIQALDLPEFTLNEISKYGLFNSQLLTCAPTGTTATMLGVSTGVEPNFAFSFNRKTVSLNEEETIYKVEADIVKQYREVTGNQGELPDYFIASHQIHWGDRIDVQAELQRWIDASISSTINLPESTTIDEVFKIYIKAWERGCKGITIWRDNCQRQGILYTNEEKKKEEKPEITPNQLENSHELKRGEIIAPGDHWLGLKRTLVTGCGTLHVTAYFDPDSGELRECYLSKGSTGGCNNFMVGLSRMISLSARGGIGIEKILDQLKSCGVCPSYAVRSATKKDTSKGSCCPVAVGNALKDMYKEIQDIICECNKASIYVIQKTQEVEMTPGSIKLEPITNKIEVTVPKEIKIEAYNGIALAECPNCHEKTLIHTGGCVSCSNCSWTRCS